MLGRDSQGRKRRWALRLASIIELIPFSRGNSEFKIWPPANRVIASLAPYVDSLKKLKLLRVVFVIDILWFLR